LEKKGLRQPEHIKSALGNNFVKLFSVKKAAHNGQKDMEPRYRGVGLKENARKAFEELTHLAAGFIEK
jgi:hypothetical protein